MTVLFVSDTHFGHAHIVTDRMQARRPFGYIKAHDEALIANWNVVVGPGDTVWHLGDFCYCCSEDYARSVFRRLTGRQRFLIRGSDEKVGARLPWNGIFNVVRLVVPLVVPNPVNGASFGLWLSHFANRVWLRMQFGDLHLYGHSHSSLLGTAARTGVGVHCFGLPYPAARGLTRRPRTSRYATLTMRFIS